MARNSKVVKYKSPAGESIPHLYIDTVTGIFYVRVYDKGHKMRSLKTKSFTTAKMRMSGVIKEILTTKKRKTNEKLVRDYYEEFKASLASEELAEATLTSYRTSWVHHIEPFWGNYNEGDLNQAAYAEFLAWHRKTKGGKLFNPLKLFRKLLSFMRKSGARFDLVEIYLPKKELDQNKESKGTYIEPAEFNRIASTDYMQGYAGLMARMSYVLGFRLGELTGLKRERLRHSRGSITIELLAKDTKTRTARAVPLTDVLSSLLSHHLATTSLIGSPYVFPSATNKMKPIAKQTVDRIWIKAKNQAGIRRRMRYHDLRHTAATNMAELGIEPIKACALLGMSLKIYTSTYVKTHALNLSSVVETLGKGLR